MPTPVTKYRVFIATPGALDDIRRSFQATLNDYNRREAIPRNVLIEPVGWEATLPGAGRPQALINADIERWTTRCSSSATDGARPPVRGAPTAPAPRRSGRCATGCWARDG